MSELDLLEKAVLGTGGAAGVVLLLFKLISFIKKEQAGQAGDDAIAKQFKALQEQIKQCQEDNAAVRAENAALREDYNRLDGKLHKQQRTITRMEMLLRQFSGLVQEHGIPVPAFMQAELEDLITPNEEKPVPVVMNRRSTD